MDDVLRNNSREEIQISEDEIIFSSQKSNISSRLNEIVAFQQSIYKFQEKMNLQLNGIINLIKNFIVVNKTEYIKSNQLFSYSPLDYQLTMEKVNQIVNNAHKKLNEAMIERLNNLKDTFESYSLIQIQEAINEEIQFSCKQINNYYQQNEHCQAITINQFNSIVIASYNFKNYQMNIQPILDVQSLYRIHYNSYQDVMMVQLLFGIKVILNNDILFKKYKNIEILLIVQQQIKTKIQ